MSTRRDIRNTPDDQSLKVASDALIVAVGGPDRACGYSRPDRRRHSDYAVPNTDAFMPIDAVKDLEKRAAGTPGWPQVTRELARQTGHVLVKVPASAADATADIQRCAGEHAKEASDVTSRILAAASRGRLTAKMIKEFDLVRECREAVEQTVRLAALVEAITEEGGD